MYAHSYCCLFLCNCSNIIWPASTNVFLFVGTWCQEEEEWAQESGTGKETSKADQTAYYCERLWRRVCRCCCKGRWGEWGQGKDRPIKSWLQTGGYRYQGWKVCALDEAQVERYSLISEPCKCTINIGRNTMKASLLHLYSDCYVLARSMICM